MAEPIIGKELLYLTEAEVVSLMPCAGAVADQIVRLSTGRREGRVLVQPKAVMGGGDMATFFIMPAAQRGSVAGIKWLGGAPTNPARGIPAFVGSAILSDAATGAPVAIMGAAETTVQRTAALSLLAARRLARPDARTIGLVGAGRQAAAHLRAMREHFPIDRVLVSSVGDTAQAFRDRWSEAGLAIDAVPVDTLLRESDIVISAVAADPGLQPFLDARSMKPGAFAAMPDLGKPWLVPSLDAFAATYTDDMASSEARGRSVAQMAAVRYAGDLDRLGDSAPLALAPADRTAFLFAGTAIADFAIAMLVHQAAIERGIGRILPL